MVSHAFLERTVRSFPGVAALTLLLLVFVLTLSACASSFSVTPTETKRWPKTDSVEVIQKKPLRPYTTIATFVGSEKRKCPDGEAFCSLIQQAKKLGANAIWIKEQNTQEYPGDWVDYQGRMIRIYPYTTTTIVGELIRY